MMSLCHFNPFHLRSNFTWPRLLLLAGMVLLLARAGVGADPTLRTELLGQLGGIDMSATVSGHFLYLGEGATLRILDISNPATPVETGRVLLNVGGVYKIVIAGDLAYVGAFDSSNNYDLQSSIGYLDIVDVHDPAAPRLRSSLSFKGIQFPYGVAVEGNLVCVAADQALYLIDVSHPDQPVIVKTWPTLRNYYVALRDGLAYLTNNGEFQILDVHDPSNPVQHGAFSSNNSYFSICLAGNLAVLGGNNSFALLNVSDPTSPTLYCRMELTDGYVRRAIVADQKAYLLHSTKGLLVYDISNPSSPTLNSARKMRTYEAYDLALAGHIAYVPDNYGYEILDVSDPTDTTLLADKNRISASYFTDLATTGSLACLFYYNQLMTLDLKELATPRQPGRLTLSYDRTEPPKRMAFTGRLGLIAAGTLGVQIVDLSQPATPTLLTTYDTPGYAYNVVAEGSLAYVADGTDGLLILDISDPTSPTLRRRVAEVGAAYNVALASGRAYISNNTSLQCIDVTDPDQPRTLGTLAINGGGYVAVDGSTVYALYFYESNNRQVAVCIADFRDPAAPKQLATVFADMFTEKIDVDQGMLYVMSPSNLAVYNVSNPRAPRLLGRMTTGSPNGFVANRGIIYLCDSNYTLSLFKALLPVRLLSPNGGQTLRGGDAVTVHWKTDLQVAGTAVRLELWNSQGRVAILGEGWSLTGEGETSVLVPMLPEGSDYRLRVASSWAPSLYDEADAPFTILANPNAAVEAGEWTLYQ